MAEMIEAISDYKIHQQTYCLSILSNACGGTRGRAPDLEKELATRVQKFIGTIPGSWKVGYGPCVYKSNELKDKEGKETGPENAWFAATGTNDGKNYCVVAVAGTARHSPTAAAIDINVAQMVDFGAWTKNWTSQSIPLSFPALVKGPSDPRPFISYGTAIAVRNVLVQKAARSQTLHQYLAELPNDHTIIFTGHSLGAAITPTAALGLKERNLLGNKTIYVVPSAGASPGVRAFAEKYANSFSKQVDLGGAKVFNLAFYNEWDVVPQAWAVDASIDPDRNFDTIEKTYEAATPEALEEIRKLVAWAKGLPMKNHPAYVPLPGRSFKAAKPKGTTKDGIKDEAGKQHADYYWPRIGVEEFANKVKSAFPDLGMEPTLFAATADVMNELESLRKEEEEDVEQRGGE